MGPFSGSMRQKCAYAGDTLSELGCADESPPHRRAGRRPRARARRARQRQGPRALDAHAAGARFESSTGRASRRPGRPPRCTSPGSPRASIARAERCSRPARSIPVVPASVKAVEGYNHVGDISFDGADGKRVLLPLECYTPGRAERRQHLRHGRDRHGGPGHARVPLLREARPDRDRQGHVGRGVAGRAPVDLERQRPAGLPRGRREPGERGPGGPADPFGAAPGGRRAAERRDRRGVPGRSPVPGGRAGHHLPDLVREPRHRRAPPRGGDEERPG